MGDHPSASEDGHGERMGADVGALATGYTQEPRLWGRHQVPWWDFWTSLSPPTMEGPVLRWTVSKGDWPGSLGLQGHPTLSALPSLP